MKIIKSVIPNYVWEFVLKVISLCVLGFGSIKNNP